MYLEYLLAQPMGYIANLSLKVNIHPKGKWLMVAIEAPRRFEFHFTDAWTWQTLRTCSRRLPSC